MQWLSGVFGQPTQPEANRPGTSDLGGGTFKAGDYVEYFSASSNSWIPAKVLEVTTRGTYNLDCKPDVPASKIRRPSPGGSGGAMYSVGEMVEYYSASQKTWIPAKVLAVNANGTYNLDCKPNVAIENIRRALGTGGLGTGGLGTGGFGTGGFSPDARPLSSGNLPRGPPAVTPAVGVPPGKGSADLLNLDAPVQLLRVNRDGTRWRYEVCEEGARVLERQGSRRIAVASICGLYRTGKSYLLNLLLERVQKGQPLFQVGGTTRACTEGLWLWGSIDSSNDQSPLLAFLDCEGFGSTDSDRTRDAQLMTLCALLSSVLVLNTKGALNESIFNALALTCRFAEHIEERGNEASRPTLLWVLRDFMLDLVDQKGAAISPDEYLEQALSAAPLAVNDEGRSQAARDVRQSLLRFFSSRSCVTMVTPVIEESQLQRLQTLPYSSLRKEFRAGVDALRAQLVSTCHNNPKAIGGQPLGCFSFIALLRQLTQAINENKMLSVKGAWESVQHTACISLTDELRQTSMKTLHTLSTGERLPGGAQLPMNDESLRMVLRQQRHDLKTEWQDRAVGDEAVRKEYWQELKESLAREEAMVRQQNGRLADQKLQTHLKDWQAWLDDDNASLTQGSKVVSELGSLMDRMPGQPLSRAARAAIEAACTRVHTARQAVAGSASHAHHLAETVKQQEGAARSDLSAALAEASALKGELDAKAGELKGSQESLRSVRMELEGRDAELRDAKKRLQDLLVDIEAARNREHELASRQRIQEERAQSLQGELEEARATSTRAEHERWRLEEQVRTHDAERQRILNELEEERGKAHGATNQLTREREALRSENEKTRTDHLRLLEDARKRADEERQQHTSALEGERGRLLDRERNQGILEGQVAAQTSEITSLRERISDLELKLRQAEGSRGEQQHQQERLKSDLDLAKNEAAEQKRRADDQAREKADLEKKLEAKSQPKACCTVQ